ncbi:hypothetical protein INR49_027561 [Caranx melampygus]|nr:hypothetical protein INR49_027561 [Caranx melampygus]
MDHQSTTTYNINPLPSSSSSSYLRSQPVRSRAWSTAVESGRGGCGSSLVRDWDASPGSGLIFRRTRLQKSPQAPGLRMEKRTHAERGAYWVKQLPRPTSMTHSMVTGQSPCQTYNSQADRDVGVSTLRGDEQGGEIERSSLVLYEQSCVTAPGLTGLSQLIQDVHCPGVYLEMWHRLIPKHRAEPAVHLRSHKQPEGKQQTTTVVPPFICNIVLGKQ